MIGSLGQEFFMSIFVGFLGGLASGIGVYVVRQKRRTDRLRRAICTEIQRTPVGPLLTPKENRPPES